MKLDPLRYMFRPLLGSERPEITTRFLYPILSSALGIELLIIIFRSLSGVTLLNNVTLSR